MPALPRPANSSRRTKIHRPADARPLAGLRQPLGSSPSRVGFSARRRPIRTRVHRHFTTWISSRGRPRNRPLTFLFAHRRSGLSNPAAISPRLRSGSFERCVRTCTLVCGGPPRRPIWHAGHEMEHSVVTAQTDRGNGCCVSRNLPRGETNSRSRSVVVAAFPAGYCQAAQHCESGVTRHRA